MGKSILVIPDAHAQPGVSNERFDWLGKYIVSKKPDIIVSIGDFADMRSLSSYDIGKADAENQRYSEDLLATNDAIKRLMLPIIIEKRLISKNKRKPWNPKFFITTGNHEQRIFRYANDNPNLEGHLTIDDLHFKKWGWEVVPFLEPLIIEGICFQHYFTSGLMGRPISGDNVAATMVKKNFMSCVAGHTHTRSLWETVDAKGKKLIGVQVGCYFEHDENHRFWRGVVRLHNVKDGVFDPEFVPLEYLKERYYKRK